MLIPIYISIAMLVLGLRLIFAYSVYLDSREFEAEGRTLYFVGPIIWAFSVIISGILGVLVYWMLHHSGLSRKW